MCGRRLSDSYQCYRNNHNKYMGNNTPLEHCSAVFPRSGDIIDSQIIMEQRCLLNETRSGACNEIARTDALAI